ncbi:hypothetical protein HQ590_15965, partial [bacterium]|nr:hypothetical protein [bacterium]
MRVPVGGTPMIRIGPQACLQFLMVAVLSGIPLAATAGTLNWTANGAALILSDGATLTPTGRLVRLGYFTIGDGAVTNGATNAVTLNGNFVELQAGLVGDNTPGSPGLWGKTFNGDFSGTYSNFAGRTIYLWTFDAATVAGATQQGIIRFDDTFPSDKPAPEELSLDLSTVLAGAGSILIGTAGGGTIVTDLGLLPFAQMAVISTPPAQPVAY